MGPYGLHMGPYGSHMDPCGSHMGPYGPHTGSYGIPLGPYGAHMGPCSSGARNSSEIIDFEGIATGSIPLGVEGPPARGPGTYICIYQSEGFPRTGYLIPVCGCVWLLGGFGGGGQNLGWLFRSRRRRRPPIFMHNWKCCKCLCLLCGRIWVCWGGIAKTHIL